ncbi:hypothetical protein L1987_71437 [Smallanthus sonchifolius]|uniref:Uncharacterized protein n=1 Tax=Smallanthus sonchifolius TaxID=185202 RepID=A0ACB9AT93_9ASTR|nr:hypothetical protein L1987_71437 [Smallanthus sonchifolius]
MKVKLLESTLGLIEIFWNSRNTNSPASLSLSPGSHCMFLLVLVVCFYLIGTQGMLTGILGSRLTNCTLCLGVHDFRNGHGWMMNSRSSVVRNIDG